MQAVVTLLSRDEEITQDVRVSYWLREENGQTWIMNPVVLDPVVIEASDVDMDVEIGICAHEGLEELDTRLFKSVEYEVVEPVTL